MTKRVAVYAGSFDPVTNGHIYMIQEGAKLFDELIVAIGINPAKKYTFSLDTRLDFLKRCTAHIPNVRIDQFTNMYLVNYARQVGAKHILRGIRNAHDYEFERSMRYINADFDPTILGIYLMPDKEFCEISSSFVKGLVGPSGWKEVTAKYIPAAIHEQFVTHFEK